MIRLLATNPFEKITVSELCRQADTSRITFYTYYEDKYDMMNELFMEYTHEAMRDYRRLQNENNPEKDVLKGYYNLLDCILNLYYNNLPFFSTATAAQNPYLYSSFYNYIFDNLVEYIDCHQRQIVPKYSSRQTAALLSNGLLGVITECYFVGKPSPDTRNNIRSMYRDILASSIFVKIPVTDSVNHDISLTKTKH